MKITRTVKKILDNYRAIVPHEGQPRPHPDARRLGGSGKMVILPVDQGSSTGPTVPSHPIRAYDPHYHYQLAIDAGLNAYLPRCCSSGRRHLRRRHPHHPEAQLGELAVDQQDQAVTAR